MTPSPALVLLTFDLLHAIRVAANPETPTPIAGPARRDAIRFARQAVREVVAMRWQEDLRASVEQSALCPPISHYRADDTPKRWSGHTGTWTGD